MRRIREREAAPPLAGQHDVHVLAGLPGEWLDRRQAQPQAHDVRREPLHARDARRQLADLDVGDVADLARLDDQVLERARLADERVARRLLRRVDARRSPVRIGNAAGQQAYAAGAAGAALAAVREVEVLAERGGEDRLVGPRVELAVGGQDPDLHPPIIAAEKKRPRIFRCGAMVIAEGPVSADAGNCCKRIPLPRVLPCAPRCPQSGNEYPEERAR